MALNTTIEWGETCGENKGSFYRLDNWIEIFKDYTFKTTSTHLSLEEARAIKKFKEISKQLMTVDTLARRAKDPDFKGSTLWCPEYFEKIESQVIMAPEELMTLKALETRLESLIRSFSTGKVFAKLSTRSPKDAGVWTERMEKIFFEQLSLLHEQPVPPELSHAYDYIAFVRSAQYSLAVSSGKEVLQLFMRSKRIYEDLTFGELSAGDKLDLRIEIREWCPEILPEREFRLFVWNRKLVGISQYYSEVYVPDIHQNRDIVKKKIEDFYRNELEAKIPDNVKNFTVDIAVSENLNKIWLIEVGNAPPVAGTGLFDWEHEEDMHILTGRGEGVDFRVLDKFDDETW